MVYKLKGISINNGSTIEFNSIEEAIKNGFSKSGIYRCLKGLSEHYKGYIWYGK